MDPFLARTMVETLSKGIDPRSGRVLPRMDSCYSEEIQEALLEVLEHCTIESEEQYLVRLKEEKKAENTRKHPRGGKPWSVEEERKMLALHRTGHSIYQIAKELQRTPVAIESRLKKLREQPIYRSKTTKTTWW